MRTLAVLALIAASAFAGCVPLVYIPGRHGYYHPRPVVMVRAHRGWWR